MQIVAPQIYKRYRSEFTKTRHFKRKIHFLLGGGLAPSLDLSPGGPNPRPQPSLLGAHLRPQNSSQVYIYAWKSCSEGARKSSMTGVEQRNKNQNQPLYQHRQEARPVCGTSRQQGPATVKRRAKT